MSKFYIAGCGRSGTTLMLRMFRNFSDCHVVLKESPFSILNTINIKRNNVIAKRNAAAWKTLHDVPYDIKVFYMVRNPFDVLTSYHPNSKKKGEFYISLDRWVNEYLSYKKLIDNKAYDQVHVVRYEDLVSDPDGVQDKISEFSGLEKLQHFSSSENLSPKSIGKYKSNKDFEKYLIEISDNYKEIIIAFCQEFGYGCELYSEV